MRISTLDPSPNGDVGPITGIEALGWVRYEVRRLRPLGRTWALFDAGSYFCGLLMTGPFDGPAKLK